MKKSPLATTQESLGKIVTQAVLPEESTLIAGHAIVDTPVEKKTSPSSSSIEFARHQTEMMKVGGIPMMCCKICGHIKPRNGWKNPICPGTSRISLRSRLGR
jgi:hypothetical protein